MQVLDVGCGVSIDLPSLAHRVGERGRLAGLQCDSDLVRVAQQAMVEEGLPAIRVVLGDAEQMPFDNAQIDRVRADRAIQHMRRPERASAEMWRVLRPSGVLTLVEPDWARLMLTLPARREAITTAPSGASCPISTPTGTCLDRSPVICPPPPARWCLGTHRVQAMSFTHASWKVIDVVCQVSATARACAIEDPTSEYEIKAWLQALEVADRQEEFLASVPLFFAFARKS